MMCFCFGNSALAVCIPFDVHTTLEPIQIKSGDTGIQPYGTYLASGSCEIQEVGTGQVRVIASTSCYRISDTVIADIYLESKEGGYWWTVTYKEGSGSNTNYVYTSKDVAVKRGQYYRARGSHIVKKGSTTETAGTVSGSMYID
ncbi:hypothetical protein BRYFOR_08309 [Marvinbryantia formatexigens DSM 14469]|uniref:Uncharacterized protein n=1 Tax=Marvinbryantia formatexigens DSM 14469 TaxID=478749 RepID=C6LI38_9FIRM|nr:DUF6147 family protein [Marvinbryantia formatexigens]EET59693.1 hypothetical protein BRYFOR_08309 [Marvinbryantia formatexigens DSM 14469]